MKPSKPSEDTTRAVEVVKELQKEIARLKAEHKYLEYERKEWERLAHEWEAAHDKLQNKYEPRLLEYSEQAEEVKGE